MFWPPGVLKERDPNWINLEQSVFHNLSKIKQEEDIKNGYQEIKTVQNKIRHVSVEEALKELLDMSK